MKSRKRKAKRKPDLPPRINKKLRSELPRRKRTQISPILCSPSNSNAPSKSFGPSSFAAESSSGSYHGGEVSIKLDTVSVVRLESNVRSIFRKKRLISIGDSTALNFSNGEDVPSQGNARPCFEKKDSVVKENKKVEASNAEVSETSCVESNSGADFRVFGKSSSKLKNKSNSRKTIQENEDQVGQASNGILESDLEDANVSSKLGCKETITLSPCVESCAESIFKSVCSFEEKELEVEENRALEFEIPEIPRNDVNENFTVSNSDSTIEQWPNGLKYESDLACMEQFSYEDVSEYSSQGFSELQGTIFSENFDTDCSDYTPSIFLESGSEFSEKSNGDATPSTTFSFLLQYKREFSRSTASQDICTTSRIAEMHKELTSFLRFEELEDEESYQMLRNRERRQLLIRDYGNEYRSTTDFGDLILRRRSQMVHWIVELSKDMELHQETTFLGVSLLDQLLSKGFFKTGRNLEVLGIACLTLATRIEENQPYNCVRRKNFYVGSNVYSRSEVVGMEWLIGEVLKFQCFLPTVCNFLWFYLKAARADSDLENRAKLFAVLVLSDQVQFCFFPSTIAAALVILASLGGNQDAPRQRVIETHVRTKTDDLHECIESLEWLLRFL